MPGTLTGLPVINRRKVGMMSSHYDPLHPGLDTCYNGRYKGEQYREVEQIPKSRPQYGLQSATRLHEAGIAVIVDQHATVNTFPGLVHTARQAMEIGSTRSRRPNCKEGGAESEAGNWG